jgi:tripeptidyl-peptidase I
MHYSAFSTDFSIVVRGFNTLVDGTSCAAPTAAAIISMLNDIRLQNSLPALGFLVRHKYCHIGDNAH